MIRHHLYRPRSAFWLTSLANVPTVTGHRVPCSETTLTAFYSQRASFYWSSCSLLWDPSLTALYRQRASSHRSSCSLLWDPSLTASYSQRASSHWSSCSLPDCRLRLTCQLSLVIVFPALWAFSDCSRAAFWLVIIFTTRRPDFSWPWPFTAKGVTLTDQRALILSTLLPSRQNSVDSYGHSSLSIFARRPHMVNSHKEIPLTYQRWDAKYKVLSSNIYSQTYILRNAHIHPYTHTHTHTTPHHTRAHTYIYIYIYIYTLMHIIVPQYEPNLLYLRIHTSNNGLCVYTYHHRHMRNTPTQEIPWTQNILNSRTQ